jgi:hypothetical protein
LNAYDWQTFDIIPITPGMIYACAGSGLAIDSEGNPHVFYYTPRLNSNLHYSYWVDDSWQHMQIAYSSSGINSGPSVVIDDSDNIHIFYINQSQHPTYAFYDGVMWQHEVVDSISIGSSWLEIAIDEDNVPHLAYTGTSSSQLRYAYKSNDQWLIQIFDGGGGQEISLVLNAFGHPHILSASSSGGNYRYFDGAEWQSEIVPGVGSLTLDQLDRPHISYYEVNDGCYSLHYANKNTGVWQSSLVDPGTQHNKIGWDNHINIDEEGTIHIVYFAHNAARIKHAWNSNNSWNTQVFDIIGMWYSSIDFIIEGNHLYASYYDGAQGMLRIATTYQGQITSPGNLEAEVDNVNDIDLSWNHSVASNLFTNFSGYRIYNDEDSLVEFVFPGNNQHTLTGFPEGEHSFYITAVYGQNETPPSNTVEVVIELLPPTDFTAETTYQHVMCTWQEPEGTYNVTQYAVYRNGNIINQTSGTNFNDLNVPPGDYVYWVTAIYNTVHESSPSNVEDVIITGTVSTPIFSPESGVYQEPIDVAISCSTDDVQIYYTLDGNDPDESASVYIEPIAIEDGNIVIKARAYKTDWIPSEIAEAQYEIESSHIDDDLISSSTILYGNYPNPFNPETNIRFFLDNEKHVIIDIYNVKGEHIKRLVDHVISGGVHNLVWNGRDKQSKKLSSGIYLYKMTTENYTSIRRMILLK